MFLFQSCSEESRGVKVECPAPYTLRTYTRTPCTPNIMYSANPEYPKPQTLHTLHPASQTPQTSQEECECVCRKEARAPQCHASDSIRLSCILHVSEIHRTLRWAIRRDTGLFLQKVSPILVQNRPGCSPLCGPRHCAV